MILGDAYPGTLEDAGILVSINGRGRAFDNIFIERLWRSEKYEDTYIKTMVSYQPWMLDCILTSHFTTQNDRIKAWIMGHQLKFTLGIILEFRYTVKLTTPFQWA